MDKKNEFINSLKQKKTYKEALKYGKKMDETKEIIELKEELKDTNLELKLVIKNDEKKILTWTEWGWSWFGY